MIDSEEILTGDHIASAVTSIPRTIDEEMTLLAKKLDTASLR